MRAVLVCNSASGSAMDVASLKRQFNNAGIEVIAAYDVKTDLHKKLRPYLNKKGLIIAAYGGDGTISSVADELIGSQTLFAPLAGGTLNHFTKDLGVAQDLDQALHNLKKMKSKKIDVAQVNNQIFVNNSSIGLYPSLLSARREMEQKSINKWIAVIVAGIRAFIRYRHYVLEINEEKIVTPFVFVGNNDYNLENSLIGERNALNDGILSVYAVAATGRFAIIKLVVAALMGKLRYADEIKIWKTTHLTIQSKRRSLSISRDGEHQSMMMPLEYKIISGSLNVIF